MLKYLQKLFHGVMGQECVSGSARIVGSPEESEAATDTSSRIDHARDFPTPLKANNASAVDNESGAKNRVQGIAESRRLCGCYCVDRICEHEFKKKRDSNSENRKRKRAIKEKSPPSDTEGCRCENCAIVSALSECVVCLEPLQTRGVKTCPVCSNIVCFGCSEKLRHCPFCRSAEPMAKNGAVERLLGGLLLPCKNFRNGCRKMLNSETRSRHEARCDHITCPVSDACSWNGSPSSILSHLKKAHGLKPLADHGLAVEISKLREKTMTSRGEYTIYLSCYGQLFAVKVTLRRRKLILSFSQMGYVTRIARKLVEKKYAVWIKIQVAGKQYREVLSFGKFDRQTGRVEINCVTLRRPTENDHDDKDASYDEDVRIEISIKEI